MTIFTGAIGEKIVELALLWNGWAPVNLNQSVKQAPNVDILAAKGSQKISLQVKTSGLNSKSMLQLGFSGKSGVFNTKPGPLADFIIFVRLLELNRHECYVVPAAVAEQVARDTYLDWLNAPKIDGSIRDDKFPVVIRFEPNRNRPDVSNYKEKWVHYLEAWHLLDADSSPAI